MYVSSDQIEQLNEKLYTFTSLENTYRAYYKENGVLYPLDAFFDLVHEAEQKGDLLFANGSCGMENVTGGLLLSESLFKKIEDVSIDKHPRYNPEFVHKHQFLEITYVLTGKCRHTIYSTSSTEKIECIAGDLLILPPNLPHSILVNDDNSIVIDILVRKSSFDKAFLHNIPDSTILADFFTSILYSHKQPNYILFKTSAEQCIRDMIFTIILEYDGAQPYCNTIINLQLAQLFLYLLRDYSDSVTFSKEFPRDIDYIPVIIQYMENNYSWLMVKDIAKHLNFSMSHLSRIYKAYTQSTISESLRNIRMLKAAEFLIKTSKSIDEIAAMVGYEDTTNFIRRFKQHYQQTPKQYQLQRKLSQ